MLTGEVYIGTRTATLPPIAHMTMVYFCIYLVLLVMFMKFFMPMKHVILGVVMEDVELGHNRPSTINFTIVEKVLMVMGKVYIGLIPAPFPPIIQTILVDCWIFLFMVMKEVDIGIRPVTNIQITMADYKFPIKGSLKKISQGVCKEKIFKTVIKDVSYTHIKIILIMIHIQA